jgi:hypothetical protein
MFKMTAGRSAWRAFKIAAAQTGNVGFLMPLLTSRLAAAGH